MSQMLYRGFPSEMEILHIEKFVSENSKVTDHWKLWLADGTTTVLPEKELVEKWNITLPKEQEDVVLEDVVSPLEIAETPMSSTPMLDLIEKNISADEVVSAPIEQTPNAEQVAPVIE